MRSFGLRSWEATRNRVDQGAPSFDPSGNEKVSLKVRTAVGGGVDVALELLAVGGEVNGVNDLLIAGAAAEVA